MVGSEDDAQSSPETCRDVPESLQSSTHGSTRLPDMEVDHTAGPACPALNVGDYWISRHVKMITKVMISLRTWKLDLDEDEFRSVFNGTSSLREVTVKAAKQMLISIGENLVQMVDITSANPSISEHLRRAGLTLKESVERAKMPTDNGNDSDATSAISQLSSTPRPDPEGDQDPVEILERDTERLLAMEVAKTLRQLHRKHTAGTSDYQFTFEQRMGLKPQSASRATEHEASNEAHRRRISSPSRISRTSSSNSRRKSRARRRSIHQPNSPPSTPLSGSGAREFLDASSSSKKPRTEHVNTQHNYLHGVEDAVRAIEKLRPETMPSLDIDTVLSDGSVHLTLLVSQDPMQFRMDSVEVSERPPSLEDSTQETMADPAEDALTKAFFHFQLNDEDTRVAPELLNTLRNQFFEPQHEVMETTPTVDAASSIQDILKSMKFTLSILQNFPSWFILTNSRSLTYTKALCVSVESSLVGDYLKLWTNLLTKSCGIMKTKPDDRNFAKVLSSFLCSLVRQLRNINRVSSNNLILERLQGLLSEVIEEFESLIGNQASKLSRSSLMAGSEDDRFQISGDDKDNTTDHTLNEMSTSIKAVQMLDIDNEKREDKSSPTVRFSNVITQISIDEKDRIEEPPDNHVAGMGDSDDPLTTFLETYETQIPQSPVFSFLCIVSDMKSEVPTAHSSVTDLLGQVEALKEIEVGQLLRGIDY
ncbi:uncharacterized protein NECHADRAFT_100310 [Fusarium vanettenii 77-13-4]|uniref:Uncharacterized protein n=1 Tax=Fusarium vanettenii (strain ATCC MYA-4622 / CBS 123669 / FGSC 9596 / NRRL 45880 / 77-13-4) TaxID=660122 RepID=C7Z847_FUSV7|nr:uncharacterized protein NECHADRAFT_100310 [Fusarium vanettenii 77-13-4]EEU39808.1 predicted protein [Fusarium vanettenii 77-13-4]